MRLICSCFFVLLFAGCATQPSDSGQADDQTDDQGSAESAPSEQPRRLYEGFFAVPGVDLSDYRQLQVIDLDLTTFEQSQLHAERAPIEALDEQDRQYYRSQYTQALVHHLVADGTYEVTTDPGPDVLRVQSRLLLVPAEQNQDPTDTSQGRLVLMVELFDSENGQLLATMTEAYPLGSRWMQAAGNGRAMQVRTAFSNWLSLLREELDQISGRE